MTEPSSCFSTRGCRRFDHLAARRALQKSIDRQRLARERGQEFETACSLLPPSFPGSPDTCPDDTPDIAAARKLVIRSGTKGSTVSVNADPLNRALAEDLVRVLDRIGYRATLWQTNDPGDTRNGAQVGVVYWHPDFPSPSDVFSPLLSCDAFIRNSQANTNISEFCNPALDASMRRAAAASSVSRRQRQPIFGQPSISRSPNSRGDSLVSGLRSSRGLEIGA